MKSVVLKCPKFGRFHFGKTGLDENSSLSRSSEYIHSDTLFSAMITMCSKIAPDEIKNLIKAFKSGGIKISSAFPCLELTTERSEGEKIIRSQKIINFLPKPSYLELLNDDAKERKKVRNIKYISKTLWESGLPPDEWGSGECLLIGRKYLLHTNDLPRGVENELEFISKINTEPKIADHLRQPRNNIFFQTDLFFNYVHLGASDLRNLGQAYFDISVTVQPHFYFLYEVQLSEEHQYLDRLFQYLIQILVDEGIGGSISTGCGRLLKSKIEDFTWNFQGDGQSAEYTTSMSLISPDPDTNDLDHIINGEIVVRGGRMISSKDQLMRLKMFKEGAILKNSVQGMVREIHETENHLRNGKAFAIPVHQNYIIDEYLQ